MLDPGSGDRLRPRDSTRSGFELHALLLGVVDLSFQTPGSEHPDQLMEALELFGKKVLPHIRDI